MSEPVSFPSTTARFTLPFLFSGQAQKEFFYNQAISALDSILQPVIEDVLSTAPSDPLEGKSFLIGIAPTGEWAGREDQIAIRIAGAWSFITPEEGMQVFNRSERKFYYYSNGWNGASEPTAPNGGATVDQEARAQITEMLEALRIAGIFPMPSS